MTNKELAERLRQYALMVDGFLQSIVSRVTTHKEFKDAQNELAKIMDIAAALEAQPEGYVLVPREPTNKMIDALGDSFRESTCFDDIPFETVSDAALQAYRAMIAAAPAGGKPSSTT